MWQYTCRRFWDLKYFRMAKLLLFVFFIFVCLAVCVTYWQSKSHKTLHLHHIDASVTAGFPSTSLLIAPTDGDECWHLWLHSNRHIVISWLCVDQILKISSSECLPSVTMAPLSALHTTPACPSEPAVCLPVNQKIDLVYPNALMAYLLHLSLNLFIKGIFLKFLKFNLKLNWEI